MTEKNENELPGIHLCIKRQLHDFELSVFEVEVKARNFDDVKKTMNELIKKYETLGSK